MMKGGGGTVQSSVGRCVRLSLIEGSCLLMGVPLVSMCALFRVSLIEGSCGSTSYLIVNVCSCLIEGSCLLLGLGSTSYLILALVTTCIQRPLGPVPKLSVCTCTTHFNLY
jgi:hypothetical protein